MRRLRAQVTRGEQSGHRGARECVDDERVHGDRPGSRDCTQLGGQRRTLVQGGGDECTAPGQAGSVGELNGLQVAVLSHEPGDRPVVDTDSGRVQQLDLCIVQPAVAVGEHHQIVGPAAHHQRRVHRTVALCDHRDRRITHLPAVAERAVENRAAPKSFGPWNIRRPVLHTGGQQHSPGLLAGAVGQLQREARLSPYDFTPTHLYRRIAGQLGAAGSIEVGGRPPVAAQKAADSVCGQVALISRVDEQYAPPGPGPAPMPRSGRLPRRRR
ncbi:hypothetical protein ATO49_17745 [Mycolicibacterium fortuitum subsp. fortuitum DSM 46621 = ATCC 6841 = JCM 6387]|nr:hypothetical protein ATO49_17745 [Mycolicibacterium fortuitum subsp. fortuitum DSM 46621 = ATCC 6841 = JCM 6387]